MLRRVMLCIGLVIIVPTIAEAATRPTGSSAYTSTLSTPIIVPAPEVHVTVPPLPQPLSVRISPGPKKTIDWANWIVAAGTVLLALVTATIALLQRNDVKVSLGVAKEAAEASKASAAATRASVDLASRQRRETLMREANAAVHKVAIRAKRVSQLADEVKPRLFEVFGLAGRNVPDLSNHDYVTAAAQQGDRLKTISETASKLIGVSFDDSSDDQIANILRSMDELLLEVDTMQDAMTWRLRGLEAERSMLWASHTAARTRPPSPATRTP